MLSYVSEVKNRTPTFQLRWHAALASLLLVLLLPDFAAAIPVRMSAVNSDEIHQNGDPVLDVIGWRDIAKIPTCSNNGTTYYQCTSTANIDAQAALPNLAFKASFDAWNAASGGGQWTLHDGGPLPGGRFDVLIFKAVAQPTLGGLDILIMWNGLAPCRRTIIGPRRSSTTTNRVSRGEEQQVPSNTKWMSTILRLRNTHRRSIPSNIAPATTMRARSSTILAMDHAAHGRMPRFSRRPSFPKWTTPRIRSRSTKAFLTALSFPP
jgi:hypothetical protein